MIEIDGKEVFYRQLSFTLSSTTIPTGFDGAFSANAGIEYVNGLWKPVAAQLQIRCDLGTKGLKYISPDDNYAVTLDGRTIVDNYGNELDVPSTSNLTVGTAPLVERKQLIVRKMNEFAFIHSHVRYRLTMTIPYLVFINTPVVVGDSVDMIATLDLYYIK